MKILFTGDICFREQMEMDGALARQVLAPMQSILAAADYRVMNLETPLAPEGVGAPIPKSGPAIIGRPQNAAFLTAAGCDLAVLANNHTGDYGPDALQYTLDTLDAAGVAHTGAGVNRAEARKAVRTVIDGAKVSFLAMNENEFGVADDVTPGSAGFELGDAGALLAQERAVSDLVIVVFHGGNEFNPLPSPGCRTRYRTLIRLGADAVIGGHTHCIQGYEYFLGKPIVYSMGNFLFKDTVKSTQWQCGYVTMLTLDGDKLTVQPTTYRTAADASQIVPFAGETKAKMDAYIDALSAYIPDTARLSAMFECWSVTYGFSYPARFAGSDPLTAGMKNAAGLRNNLICEAHNEVCRTAYRLMFEQRVEDALSHRAELDALMRLPCDTDAPDSQSNSQQFQPPQ